MGILAVASLSVMLGVLVQHIHVAVWISSNNSASQFHLNQSIPLLVLFSTETIIYLLLTYLLLTYLLLTYLLLTYSLHAAQSFWKLTGSQLVKKFPAFYGTRRFITAFTSARHLSLSWARSIQSVPPHPTSWRSILILSSHLRLGLPSGLLPSAT